MSKHLERHLLTPSVFNIMNVGYSLKPEIHCMIFSCPRRKTGIVKQQWRIRNPCYGFTMPVFHLGQPKIMQCISGLMILIICGVMSSDRHSCVSTQIQFHNTWNSLFELLTDSILCKKFQILRIVSYTEYCHHWSKVYDYRLVYSQAKVPFWSQNSNRVLLV